MAKTYTFEVPGKPHGQMRARARAFKMPNGKFVGRVYKDKKQELQENQLGWLIAQQAPAKPHEGAMILNVTAYLPIAASMNKKEKKLAADLFFLPFRVKPDLSNIIKHIEDVMTGLFFVDDKQICMINARKYYGESPRMIIELSVIDDEAQS